jgi:hypothetical protein
VLIRSVRTPAVVVLALAFIGAESLSSCSSGPSTVLRTRTIEVDGEELAASSLREAVTGLCTALERLPADPRAARDAFYSLSHDRLHTIAAAVQEIDRSAAASLLQAMAVVEERLARPPVPPSLAGDLDRLLTATRAALRALSIPTEPC